MNKEQKITQVLIMESNDKETASQAIAGSVGSLMEGLANSNPGFAKSLLRQLNEQLTDEFLDEAIEQRAAIMCTDDIEES